MSRIRHPAELVGMSMSRGVIGYERPSLTPEERDEFWRRQRLAVARRAKWEELARADVVFARRWVEHRPTGRKFKLSRGVFDAIYSPVTAYVLTEDGSDLIALEELR